MIIYFSGTGNSLYVAKKLLDKDEKLVALSDLMSRQEFKIKLAQGEKLGFVFPVYFYTLPSIVREFIEKLEVENASYMYSVITCGGGTGQASAVLNKILQQNGMTLSYFRELLMPDNSMLFYQIPGVEKSKPILEGANKEIEAIKNDIALNKITAIKKNMLMSNILGVGYKLCSKTNKFYAEDKCIGCGLCEQNCPEQVIKLEDNKPVWTKKNCSKCSACINRCPVQAIQYGKHTIKRNRYVNPFV